MKYKIIIRFACHSAASQSSFVQEMNETKLANNHFSITEGRIKKPKNLSQCDRALFGSFFVCFSNYFFSRSIFCAVCWCAVCWCAVWVCAAADAGSYKVQQRCGPVCSSIHLHKTIIICTSIVDGKKGEKFAVLHSRISISSVWCACVRVRVRRHRWLLCRPDTAVGIQFAEERVAAAFTHNINCNAIRYWVGIDGSTYVIIKMFVLHTTPSIGTRLWSLVYMYIHYFAVSHRPWHFCFYFVRIFCALRATAEQFVVHGMEFCCKSNERTDAKKQKMSFIISPHHEGTRVKRKHYHPKNESNLAFSFSFLSLQFCVRIDFQLKLQTGCCE